MKVGGAKDFANYSECGGRKLHMPGPRSAAGHSFALSVTGDDLTANAPASLRQSGPTERSWLRLEQEAFRLAGAVTLA